MESSFRRRPVVDGERLSGHGSDEHGHPEIYVMDGKGPGYGSLMFTIQCFHGTTVAMAQDGSTMLRFQKGAVDVNEDGSGRFEYKGATDVVIHDGVVLYVEPISASETLTEEAHS